MDHSPKQQPSDAAAGSSAPDSRDGGDGAEAAQSLLDQPLLPAGFRDLVHDFYRVYDPPKLAVAESICDKYAGREGDLQQFLEAKYGVPYFSTCKLNFHSKFFDPARALYDDAAFPPILDALPLDSLYKAQKLLPASAHIDDRSKFVSLGVLHGKEAADKDRSRMEVAAGHSVTLLDYLADAHIEGPLSLLRVWFIERSRVCVLVSRPGGLRGWLRGRLVAFDGGCNLMLSDVEEDFVVDESAYVLIQPPSNIAPQPLAGHKRSRFDATSENEHFASSSSSVARGLPPGWLERRDPASGRPFWHNIYTCASQWDPPVSPIELPRYKWVRKFSPSSRRLTGSLLVSGERVISVAKEGTPAAAAAHAIRRAVGKLARQAELGSLEP